MLQYDIIFDDGKLSMDEGNQIIREIINIFRKKEMNLEAAQTIMNEATKEIHKIAVIK